MEVLLNIMFGLGRFHITPQSYKVSHGLCLNSFFQVWLLGNKMYQFPPFRYINRTNELYRLVIGRKVLGGMKYLMSSVKRAVEAVGIWTVEDWYVKRVNSLYNMVSGRLNFKINKMFYLLIWSSVVRYLYTRRGYIVGELN